MPTGGTWAQRWVTSQWLPASDWAQNRRQGPAALEPRGAMGQAAKSPPTGQRATDDGCSQCRVSVLMSGH